MSGLIGRVGLGQAGPVRTAVRRRAGGVYHRVRDGLGLAQIAEMEHRLDLVATAAAENHALADPLARHLDDLEAALVPLLDRVVTDK